MSTTSKSSVGAARSQQVPAHIKCVKTKERSPRGIPAGGQFARHAQLAAPDDVLDGSELNETPAPVASSVSTPAADNSDADIVNVKAVAVAIRSQSPDAEHTWARIEQDGTITMTHVFDAFDGLLADENALSHRLSDGTDVHAQLFGVQATGPWTDNTARRLTHGGPAGQQTLLIDLYAAAALRTAPERRLDSARDGVTSAVLAQYPDADSWEAEFQYNPTEENFALGDEIYVSSGARYTRINLRDEDPDLLDQLDDAAHEALTDISDESRYCAAVPGPYLTSDHYAF